MDLQHLGSDAVSKLSREEVAINLLLDWCSLSIATLRNMVKDTRCGMAAQETGTKRLNAWTRKDLLTYLIEVYPDWENMQ